MTDLHADSRPHRRSTREPAPLRPGSVRVRAVDSAQLLASVPYLLGYHPRDSLLVIGLEGNRLGGSARVDLAQAELAPAQHGLHIGSALAQAGIDEALIVLYAETTPPWLGDFSQALMLAGVRPAHGWQVGREEFWPLEDATQRRSSAEIHHNVIAAELVAAGLAPAPSRERLLDQLLPYPDPVRRRLARQSAAILTADGVAGPALLQRAMRVWAGWLGDPDLPLPARGRGRRPVRPLADSDLALLLAALSSTGFQDAMLAVTMVVGPPGRLGQRLLLQAREEMAGSFPATALHLEAARIEPAGAGAPDPDRMEAAQHLLAHLVRAATGSAVATATSLLAHVHWWSGSGAVANLLVDRAIAADRTNPLACHVEDLLRTVAAPPWVCVS